MTVPLSRRTRIFEDDFEAPGPTGWSEPGRDWVTDPVISGQHAMEIATGYPLGRYLNACQVLWLRWYWAFPEATSNSGPIVQLASVSHGAESPIIWGSLLEDDGGIRFAVNSHLAYPSYPRQSGYQCVELGLNFSARTWELYLDGNPVTVHQLDSPVEPDCLYLRFSNPDAAPYYLDAVAADRRRIGALTPGANSGAFLSEHDVILNGVGFNILENLGTRLRALSPFNPRLGVGAPKYSDLSGFQHYLIPSQHNGLGQAEISDENQYLTGMNIDPTAQSFIRLANVVRDHPTGHVPNLDAYLAGGRICSTDSGAGALFGLGFGREAPSAPRPILYSFDGTTALSYSLTSSYGIQDILDNGSHIFVTTGGGSVYKSAVTGGLTFTEGEVAFTVDDCGVSFAPTYTWSTAGSTVLPPTDMGQMAIYDEFVWVAERDAPWVHRAAQVDLSDLEGGNPDEDSPADSFAVRVGPGRVPITAMCAYAEYLYVGREDGLYRINMDANDVYTHLVEPVVRARDNYRGMCVYNGYLVYQENGRVYEFNGSSKQDITPGALSLVYPYERIQQWAGFSAQGKYLVAIASPDDPTNPKPRWYVMVHTQGPWHIVGQLDNGVAGRTDARPEPCITQSEYGAPQLRVCSEPDSDGTLHVHSQDMRHGIAPGGDTAPSGWITSSVMDFGLPRIARSFSLLHEDVEGIVPGINRVRVYASIDGGPEWLVGTIAAPDSPILEFPPGTVGYKLVLRHVLESTSPDLTPILRRTVIRYMDRPEAVWGYELSLDLANVARTYPGDATSYTPLQVAALLRQWRDQAEPMEFIDRDGHSAEVYLTDVEIRMNEGFGAEVTGVASIALMEAAASAYPAAYSGLPYEVDPGKTS